MNIVIDDKIEKIVKQLLFLSLLTFNLIAKAQVYPVQVIPQINPPYNVTLPSYTTTTSDKINVRLILTDINVGSIAVHLKLKIKGQGLNIQSTDFVVGAAPITLTGGAPTVLSTIDLQPYFRLNNLVGIPPPKCITVHCPRVVMSFVLRSIPPIHQTLIWYLTPLKVVPLHFW